MSLSVKAPGKSCLLANTSKVAPDSLYNRIKKQYLNMNFDCNREILKQTLIIC